MAMTLEQAASCARSRAAGRNRWDCNCKCRTNAAVKTRLEIREASSNSAVHLRGLRKRIQGWRAVMAESQAVRTREWVSRPASKATQTILSIRTLRQARQG